METLRNYLETMFQRYPQTAEAEKDKEFLNDSAKNDNI